ncbi:MAG: MaoC family dehydratase N-terminal domain-containing protein [Thermoanaerobacteraceae bacterium]|nr:MaoC family dehydratase N-terminal domain-containing protein [Thermoanaerobacteraceae bacterium]
MSETRLFFDELNIGDEAESAGRTITETDVVNFAGLSGDFNALHMDAEFAKKTIFGERVAHGMCVASIASGLWFSMPRLATLAFLGLDDWRFVKPVKFGDTIKVKRKVSAKKETKPDRGIVTFDIEVINQNGEVVQQGKWNMMVQNRQK